MSTIYSRSEPERSDLLRSHASELVVLVTHPVRGATELEEKVAGELIGIARAKNGATANLAIVQELDGRLSAVSVATVASIETPGEAGLLEEFEEAIEHDRLNRYRVR